MNHAAIHQFNFLIPEALTPKQIDRLTMDMFGQSIKSFRPIERYRKAYRRHYSLQNMVNIYCDGAADNNGTTYIEINGLGCETLNIDFKRLALRCVESGYRINSLHLLLDDTSSILPMDRLCNEFKPNYKKRIISKFKKSPVLIDSSSRTLQFGSNKSKLHIIFYEKGLFEKVDFSWQRVELHMSDPHVIHAQLEAYANGTELGIVVAGLLASAIDFKVDGVEIKAKRQTEQFWSDFLNDVEKRSYGTIPVPRLSSEKRIANLLKHIERELRAIGNGGLSDVVGVINNHIGRGTDFKLLQLVPLSSL